MEAAAGAATLAGMTSTTTLPGCRTSPARRAAARHPLGGSSLAWAAYAASAWAAAYAIFVRGYQGLGGTAGLAGTFEDPAGMRRASLTAGAFLLLVAVGELGLVREWGRRFPRPLVIAPALAGSVFAAAHALTAYITKPLDALGLIHLELRGWAHVDAGAQMRWDLLFYEPWFLGLALLTVVGTLHHHRRTGGSPAAARRLILATAAGTAALTAYATVLVVT
jgi:hypothetical protein